MKTLKRPEQTKEQLEAYWLDIVRERIGELTVTSLYEQASNRDARANWILNQELLEVSNAAIPFLSKDGTTEELSRIADRLRHIADIISQRTIVEIQLDDATD